MSKTVLDQTFKVTILVSYTYVYPLSRLMDLGYTYLDLYQTRIMKFATEVVKEVFLVIKSTHEFLSFSSKSPSSLSNKTRN